MNLESGDTVERAGRGTDFGGEIRECGEVVAEDCAGVGETVAGELHAVA